MKRSLVCLLVAAVLAVVVEASTAAGGTAPRSHAKAAGPLAPAVAATDRLAVTLLPRLGGGADVVFSPYSIATALAMIDQGAAGATASEIGRLLGTLNSTALGTGEAALAARLRNVAVVPPAGSAPGSIVPVLHVANGLWVDSGLALESPFENALSSDFGAIPQTAAFATAPDRARQAINAWVAGHTAQLIRGLMPPGTITARTRLVLANAIYLRARWSNPFVKAATAAGSFDTGAGARVTVPFMTEPPTEFAYGHGAGYRAIDLPYIDSSLSMLIVMPAAGSSRGSSARSPQPRCRG